MLRIYEFSQDFSVFIGITGLKKKPGPDMMIFMILQYLSLITQNNLFHYRNFKHYFPGTQYTE